MTQAIGRPRNGAEPPFLDGFPIHQTGAVDSIIDTLESLSYLAERCPIGAGASQLLIFLLVSDAFVACIASRIVAGFASPLTGSPELAQQCDLFLFKLSFIYLAIHCALHHLSAIGKGAAFSSMSQRNDAKD
jgi:hypothetical protein